MAHIIVDEPIIMKMNRPGASEKKALRDLFVYLQPLMPMLKFLAEISVSSPSMADKRFELSHTGISVALSDVVKLLVLMERIERELLTKE